MTKVYDKDASGNLFNTILAEQDGMKNDSALAKAIGVKAPVISKIRNGGMPVGATMIIRIHETFGYEIKRIKQLITEKPPAVAEAAA